MYHFKSRVLAISKDGKRPSSIDIRPSRNRLYHLNINNTRLDPCFTPELLILIVSVGLVALVSTSPSGANCCASQVDAQVNLYVTTTLLS